MITVIFQVLLVSNALSQTTITTQQIVKSILQGIDFFEQGNSSECFDSVIQMQSDSQTLKTESPTLALDVSRMLAGSVAQIS